MQTYPWKQWLRDRVWAILPGVPIVGMIVLARLLGMFQLFEWQALDRGLKGRPAEGTDGRITIVAITEADIQAIGDYPIPSQTLTTLLTNIQRHQPRVIGLDIFRDLPVDGEHRQLLQLIQDLDNLVVINKILPTSVAAPESAPESRIGFVDTLLDGDGFVRRSLLGATDGQNNYRFSFTIRITEHYLEHEGVTLKNGIRNPNAMRFGPVELPPFTPNAGGYVRADAGGEQMLVNFRSGANPFDVVTYSDIQTGKVSPTLLNDRIVLVGVTAESVKDVVNTSATAGINAGWLTGIEFQAHAISQVLNAVLEGRPLLKGWPDWLEYGWIIGWGLAGIMVARLQVKSTYYFVGIVALGVGLLALGQGLLWLSWWIPTVPAVVVFFLNGVALYPSYRTQHELQLRLADRQELIERTFDQIHNGPLQKLATILSRVSADPQLKAPLHGDLDALNQDLRGIYEAMQQEFLYAESCLQLEGNCLIQLDKPLHEILYEVYEHTLQREEFPHFANIKILLRTFDPMADRSLPLEQKRELGRFLEEALCNVGKYAENCSRLTVFCSQQAEQNIIRVTDNGQGPSAQATTQGREGRGTQQAKQLAKRLGGQFQRNAVSPRGCCSELAWPIQPPLRLWRR